MSLVLDASATVDYLLTFGAFERIAERIAVRSETLHAPHVLDLEVAQAMRRLTSRGTITASRAQGALEDYAGLHIRRYSHGWMLPRIWQLRENVTAFDAAYITLSEALDAPLLTADGALARSSGHGAAIELFR